jgi:hypothetical protein
MASLAHSSWTKQAEAIVLQACEHYGGMGAWRALRTVRLLGGKLSGLVPWLKGSGTSFVWPSAFEVTPHERSTRFVDYPIAGQVGIFSDGAVRIERLADASVVAQNEMPRKSVKAAWRWGALEALYFFGYALAHYHSLPFTLLEGRLLGMRSTGRGRARLNVLKLELPRALHTHGPRQSFYFDVDGRLVRHDYHAEVAGFWAHGAHYWKRQVMCSGVPIALERHVLGRLGSVPFPLTALHATFEGAEVELAPRVATEDGAARR